MAPHSSTLAWKIPWMEEPGGLQSMGSWRVRHNWATPLSFSLRHRVHLIIGFLIVSKHYYLSILQNYGKVKDKEPTEYQIGSEILKFLTIESNPVGKQDLVYRTAFVGAPLSRKAKRPSWPTYILFFLPASGKRLSMQAPLVVLFPLLSSLSPQHSHPRTDTGNRYQTPHT